MFISRLLGVMLYMNNTVCQTCTCHYAYAVGCDMLPHILAGEP
jgi:hypothetical protein